MEWFWGRGLLASLSGKDLKVGEVIVEEKVYRLLLGGRALAAYVWATRVGEKTPGPLSPENPLVIAPGGLVGSGLSTASKTAFVARSPLTGLLGRSMTGGRIGWEIRRAGYDFLVLEGALDEPSILVIDGQGVRVEPAGDLWGLRVSEARASLSSRYKQYADAIIGPAGENKSAIAGIDTNGRQAGRNGLGAVMGSKKLKAILVKGWSSPTPHDREGVLSLIRELNKSTHTAPASKNLVEYGTPLIMDYTNKAYGVFPSLDWTRSTLGWCGNPDEAHEELTRFAPKYRVGKNPCIGCARPCSQVIKVDGGEVDGPDYETTYALGSDIGVCKVRDVGYLNMLADEYGFDTISLGATIAWAIHAAEKGLLDAGLKWGDVEGIAKLIVDMAYRRGLGELLADGSLRAAKKLGKGEELVMHSKGMEAPAYDARGLKGMALGYAVGSRGADHLTSGAYVFELYGRLWTYEKVDRLAYEGKGVLIRDGEDLMAFYDDTGICKFSRGTLTPETIAPFWTMVTGLDASPGDMLLAGERTVNLERLVNLHLGLNPLRDDTLSERFYEEPISDGPSKGEVVDKEGFQKMLAEYYAARGWTSKGVPLESTMVRLGLRGLIPGNLAMSLSRTPG